eukprot:TRINITY_DN10521_c0_g1_i6.p2 TRINITY_DN10521_c0_g1~~TRINITY_DN10521_c0_g1_i6.p2  ORF type:complete len:133 (+),score=35.08 TRINITY_DN10521_c0_g1_i6:184-582(+)
MKNLWEEAKALEGADALPKYMAIIQDESGTSEDDQKIKENAIYAAANIFVAKKSLADLTKLIATVRPLTSSMPQARVAKIIRVLYEMLPNIPGGLEAAIDIGKEIIEWCVPMYSALIPVSYTHLTLPTICSV